jgi:hypothetical protein
VSLGNGVLRVGTEAVTGTLLAMPASSSVGWPGPPSHSDAHTTVVRVAIKIGIPAARFVRFDVDLIAWCRNCAVPISQLAETCETRKIERTTIHRATSGAVW